MESLRWPRDLGSKPLRIGEDPVLHRTTPSEDKGSSVHHLEAPGPGGLQDERELPGEGILGMHPHEGNPVLPSLLRDLDHEPDGVVLLLSSTSVLFFFPFGATSCSPLR